MKDVSVIVITYNSEKWIIETLESIKNQTYKNIELIISDDASKDKTIDICKKWICENRDRFIRVEIIQSLENDGVTKNINKGIKRSSTKWIKLIAGDDILLEDCIESNINYCNHNNIEICFSKVIKFKNTFNQSNFLKKEENKIKIQSFKKNSKLQFKELVKNNFVEAPTLFIKKSLIEKMNYFDESYPMVEDYPMWLKLTEKGIKLNFMDKETVYYRIHEESISNKQNNILNIRMFEFRKKIYLNYISKKVKNPLFHYSEKLFYLRGQSIINNGNRTRITFISILTYLIDPYTYLKILKKILDIKEGK
ncbi:glycosyltransferase [Cetobacterium sp.]|uniref:glycosyltransferase n=1 Tax=Cetobacterium sp. TaxID=2071632 RepID=UPI003F3BF61E